MQALLVRDYYSSRGVSVPLRAALRNVRLLLLLLRCDPFELLKRQIHMPGGEREWRGVALKVCPLLSPLTSLSLRFGLKARASGGSPRV